MAKRKDKPETVEDESTQDETAQDPTDPTVHVFLEGARMNIADLGIDNPRERRILFGGLNYEHVDEIEGCWNYRRM